MYIYKYQKNIHAGIIQQKQTRPPFPFPPHVVTEVDLTVPLPQLIKGMVDQDSWDDAGLAECLAYVQRSKYLFVTDEFKEVFPWKKQFIGRFP